MILLLTLGFGITQRIVKPRGSALAAPHVWAVALHLSLFQP